jgi:hypothetical protein
MATNLWVNEEHAISYLREREALAHRVDALEQLCELLPEKVERVLDLGTARQRALYAEIFGLLRPGGRFVNAEHVASPTTELHEEFLAALGRRLYDDDPSNELVAVAQHLTWLNEIGFTNSDCFWKWRELAVLA